jgi:phosphomannomutase
MAQHFFFDLDSTLTPSRALMLERHQETFKHLCDRHDVIVVTGGAEEQIRKQIPFEPTGNFFMLSQQGNFAVHKDGTQLWLETVSPEQEAVAKPFAMQWTQEYLDEHSKTLRDPNDVWEHRGSQLASNILGFHAPNEEKYAADPEQLIRRELLARHPDHITALSTAGLQVMPAGSTTFDFILTGKHKGYNITRLLDRLGWVADDCMYFGDALFPGGNDETVNGVIPTHAVKDPDDTFNFIKQMLS